MAPQTVKTRILIISDTHSTPLAFSTSPQPFRTPLPSADVLIHCGDLTMLGLLPEYEKTLDMLKAIDAKVKLVIAGNHDRTLDAGWMERHGEQKGLVEQAREVWFGEGGRARREGVRMLGEGVHTVDVGNGAVITLYTSEYQPEFYDWAFPYLHHQDRYNPPAHSLCDAQNIATNPIPGFSDQQIDVLMTHGPPYGRLDKVPGMHVGCPHLLRAVARAKPLVHCFGHIHEGWGAQVVEWSAEDAAQCTMKEFKAEQWQQSVRGVEEVDCGEDKRVQGRCVFVDATKQGRELQRGRQTLMVNAAIMDVGYSPVNAPFLVDLDLPMKVEGEVGGEMVKE